MERVIVIGYGAIGKTVDRLMRRGTRAQLVGVIQRPQSAAGTQQNLEVRVFTSVAEALALRPTLFVECGGHEALRTHGAAALKAGVDLLAASVGAMADPVLETALREAASVAGSQILLPAGALGGLDALGAARYAGLEDVQYTSTKALPAWRGTHAESLIDLADVRQATKFFTGSAREAARLFPQNANVAAAVALAGAGFDRTRVELVADPQAKGNRHRICASGSFGTIDIAVEGRTLPENPKTSVLAPMSLVRAIESRKASVRVV